MPSSPNFRVLSADPSETRTLHPWPILTGAIYRKVIVCISPGELSGSGREVINEFEKKWRIGSAVGMSSRQIAVLPRR